MSAFYLSNWVNKTGILLVKYHNTSSWW